MKKGFTISEILITLAIVGVVASMTLPTLIVEINKKIKSSQKGVIESRLLKGINLYNSLENGLNYPSYVSTKEFLEGLSKHYKMVKICDETNLQECMPYKTIQDEGETIDISKLGTAGSFGLISSDYYSPAGFISAGGTPFFVALKKNCTYDPDTPMKSIGESGCLAMLYDINGTRKPNTVGEDIVVYNGMTPKGYFKKVNGVKVFGPAVNATGISAQQCREEKEKNYGISLCGRDNDGYAGGMKYCHDIGTHMATPDELSKIIGGLWKNNKNERLTDFNLYSPSFGNDYVFDAELAETLNLKNREGLTSYVTDLLLEEHPTVPIAGSYVRIYNYKRLAVIEGANRWQMGGAQVICVKNNE